MKSIDLGFTITNPMTEEETTVTAAKIFARLILNSSNREAVDNYDKVVELLNSETGEIDVSDQCLEDFKMFTGYLPAWQANPILNALNAAV